MGSSPSKKSKQKSENVSSNATEIDSNKRNDNKPRITKHDSIIYKQINVEKNEKFTNKTELNTTRTKINEATITRTKPTKSTSKLKDARTLRIFFSSPFGGMEEEREELTRIYLPQIRHYCTEKGLQFVAVDMRWGITTEAADNAQVIGICLQELDRSDIFVGFFGQRYGWHGASDPHLQKNFDQAVTKYPWLEGYRDRSVTELEFLHGHLNNAGAMPAYICFRDKEFDAEKRSNGLRAKDDGLVRKYTAESDHSINLMDDLKQRVQLTQNRCLGIDMAYTNPKEGTRGMFEAIWKHITNDLLKDTMTQTATQRDIELSHHDAFMASRSMLYLGGDEYVKQLNDFIYNSSAHQGIVIRGEGGSGKSALLSTWITKLTLSSPNNVVLMYHFIGCTEGSTNVPNILRRLCAEAYRHLPDDDKGDNPNPDYDKNDVISVTRYWLTNFETVLNKLVNRGLEVVVVIDGLNRVDSLGKTAKALFWIPDHIPRGAHIIVSTLTSDDVSYTKLVTDRNYGVLDVLPLSEQTQEQLCRKVLKESGKELSPSQLTRVVEVPQTHNPLYLRIFLEELCMFGDFWKLDDRINDLISSISVRELFEKYLIRLDKDYAPGDGEHNLVQMVLCSISVAHYGLSETEIMAICSLSSAQWSPLYFALEKYLVNRSGLLAFAFDELKEAIQERYLKDDHDRQFHVQKCIDYFVAKQKLDGVSINNAMSTTTARPTHELPHLYTLLSDWSGLGDTLANLVIFYRLQTEGKMYDILEMWKQTTYSGVTIASYYIRCMDEARKLQDVDIVSKDKDKITLFLVLDLVEKMLDLGDYFYGREKILLYSLSLLEENGASIEDKLRRDTITSIEYNLGCLYVNMQSHEPAYKYHMKVLAARQKIYDDESRPASNQEIVNLATSYHGIGVLYINTQEFTKAEEYLLKAKEYEEKVDDGKLSRVVTCVMNLGNVHLATQNYQKALDYFLYALQMYEELYVHQLHHNIAYIQTNIGVCYRKLNQLDKAEEFYQKSVKNKILTLGEEHPSVAQAYMNLGTLEQFRGNPQLQEKYAQLSVDIYEKNETPDTMEVVIFARENLVLCLVLAGKFEQCLSQYWKAFDANVSNDSLSKSLAVLHVKVAGFLISQGRYDEARKIVNEVVKVEELHTDVTMIQVNFLDNLLEPEHRPKRDPSLTIDHALEKWPSSMTLLGYKTTQTLMPAGNISSLLTLLSKACDSLEDQVTPDLFTTAASWCTSQDMMFQVFILGLQKLPHNKVFLANVIMTLKELNRLSETVPYALDLYQSSTDEARFQFFAVETLCLAERLTEAKDRLVDMKERWKQDADCLDKVDKAMATVEAILKEMSQTK